MVAQHRRRSPQDELGHVIGVEANEGEVELSDLAVLGRVEVRVNEGAGVDLMRLRSSCTFMVRIGYSMTALVLPSALKTSVRATIGRNSIVASTTCASLSSFSTFAWLVATVRSPRNRSAIERGTRQSPPNSFISPARTCPAIHS